ncbi:MAG: TIM barrel protein [Candidatus Woesearchaeota archaeon]|nr:TIM barrel protein [Candidatus Woesearchaeota archaeon]
MDFDNDYWNALDKRSAQYLQVDPKYIGVSTPINKKALDQLKSKMFEGASAVEIGFMGVGKGSYGQGSTTPEMHGKEEREAIRQMAKINEVTLSTHASIAVGNLSGLDLRENRFSPEMKQNNINEIKRTIDFAADTTQGGPVVVHTGEFPREIYEIGEKFEAYPKEAKKAPIYLVDKRDGKLMPLRRDIEVPEPIPDEKKPGEWKRDENGLVMFKAKKFEEFEKEANEKGEKDVGVYFYKEYLKKDLDVSRGEQERWTLNAEQHRDRMDKLKKIKEEHEDNLKRVENKEMEKIVFKQRLEKIGIMSEREAALEPEKFEEFRKNPEKFLDEEIKEQERARKFYEDAAISYGRRAAETKQIMDNIEPVKNYGVKQSADAVAQLGIYAYKKEKDANLSKPLFIAPENIFPEGGYGSSPKELKELILESRKAMTERLVKQDHMSEEEAKRVSKDHIKATFDIGHAYTWKKFFKGSDKEFNNWLKGQVEELTKDGIIGHVHLSDNFGYHDEHLEPGQGSVPIQDFVKHMQLKDYKGQFIVEWGAQAPEEAWRTMTAAWRTLNSPIYRIDTTSASWTDIENSYIGSRASPNYLVGEGIVPSKDWTLWSETQLE